MTSPQVSTVISVLISLLLCANIASTSINEDESRIYSEGMWQTHSMPQTTTISSANGNSRFDVGGFLTGEGLRQGASILGLVVFPMLFPLVALLAIAVFLISIFGTGTAVTGRQFHANESSISHPLSLDKYFSDVSSTSTSRVAESSQCVERICCEIANKSRKIASGSKIKRLMKVIGVKPSILNAVDKSLSTGHGCSIFTCRFEEVVSKMVNESARSYYFNYIVELFSQ